ncbi:hypothetical protein [Nitrosospira sp. Nsp18]|nr:hypothetical protein [Nitrosospira sp. Nsp18]
MTRTDRHQAGREELIVTLCNDGKRNMSANLDWHQARREKAHS